MPIAYMRSTIVIFIIVFAVLGLLLGFAQSYDTQPATTLPMAKEINLTFTNNSNERCNENSDDCIMVFQKP
jgi:hypothetical protein